MFWKRKKETSHGALGPLSVPPTPPKKEFETMLEMLRDAEKYNNAGENEVSDAILTHLCEYIEYNKKNLMNDTN